MAVSSVSANPVAINLRAAGASAGALQARPAEEQQESATERQQEISTGEESGVAAARPAPKSTGSIVDLLA
jgi:hypothetical protein